MAQDELARQWCAYEGFAREEFETWADHCRQCPEDWRLLWRTLADQRDRQMMWRLWREPYVVKVDQFTPRYGGGISPEVTEHDSVTADMASEVGAHRVDCIKRSASAEHNAKPSKSHLKPARQKKRSPHKPAGISAAANKITKSTKSNKSRLRSTALLPTVPTPAKEVCRPRTRLQAKRRSERRS